MDKAGTSVLPPFSPAVDRRPAGGSDREFLFGLFCSALTPDNPLLMAPPGEREMLLRMQFDGGEQGYRTKFPLADFDILLLDGTPVGKLYVDRGDNEYVLIDIALRPEFQGQGIGATVVGNLLDEAGTLFLPVRARVRKDSPALVLSLRLGFEVIGNEGAYCHILAPALRS